MYDVELDCTCGFLDSDAIRRRKMCIRDRIKVEAGQYIDLLGQDVIPIYQVITEIPGETVTNETLPLHVLLGSCGLHDAKYPVSYTHLRRKRFRAQYAPGYCTVDED